VACSRGKASPDQVTRLRLFADSAGYCQNPDCARELFAAPDSGPIHIGEMAHIFAANDQGPRANTELSAADRGAYDNLILLCPTCHTIIDKAPDAFPDDTLRRWKQDRSDKLAGVFGAVRHDTRKAVRSAIEPLMRESKHILEEYGPGTDAKYDPESNALEVWTRKVLAKIIPNNRRIIAILDANRELMTNAEPQVLEYMRQHTDDVAARHLEGMTGGRQYPAEMERMMED